jgi:hypothetical protein
MYSWLLVNVINLENSRIVAIQIIESIINEADYKTITAKIEPVCALLPLFGARSFSPER